VCIPPREVLLGLEDFEQYEERGGDRVVYALSKLVRLALDGNPNIIEVLYAEPEDVLFLRRFGERLLAERDAFLTRRVGERFLGYAGHQLRRMERHHRWLVSPPGSEPEPADHGARRADGRWRFPDTDSEKAYRAAHRHWEHFRTWRRNRNAARAELEARHGYDTKHAMHLCRLLRMGSEILEEGVVRVRRPDADWLRSVRRGAFAYEELLDQASYTRTPTITWGCVVEAPGVEPGADIQISRTYGEYRFPRTHQALIGRGFPVGNDCSRAPEGTGSLLLDRSVPNRRHPSGCGRALRPRCGRLLLPFA